MTITGLRGGKVLYSKVPVDLATAPIIIAGAAFIKHPTAPATVMYLTLFGDFEERTR